MSLLTPTGEWVFDFDAGDAISDATDGGGSAPAVEFVEASEADDEPAGSDAEATSSAAEASVTPLLPNSVAAYLADVMPAIGASASTAAFSVAPVLSDLDPSAGGGDVSVSLPPAAEPVDAAPPSSAPDASAPSAAAIAPDIRLIGIPAGPEFIDDAGMIVEDIDGDGVVVDDDPSGGGSYDGSGYSYDYSGSSLTSAGDINGDGIDDQIVSSYAYADGVYTSATYVVFGSADGSLAVSDISQIDGSNGFRIDGADSGGYGPVLSAAGDINGDGFADLIASSYGDAGACYVVFGNANGQAAIDVATLDGSNGFRIDGLVSDAYNSWWATAAGDVNGDGFDDLIIDVFNSDASGAYSQSSYVVLGSASGFAAAVDVATLEPADAYLPDPPPDEIGDDPGDYVIPDGEILPGIGDEDIIYGRPVWSKDLIDGEIPGAIDILPIYIALGDGDLL